MSNLSARIMSTLWREASVAVVPELAEKRRDTILRYKNPLQRAGALGLHGVAHCTSGAILSFLAHPYESSGMSFVGSGWNSTVLRDDGSVTKIVRRTEMMGPERRASHIAKLRELIGQNALCLGDMVVNSTVCEISHPLSSRPVVAITQPYVEGYDALANPVSSDVK